MTTQAANAGAANTLEAEADRLGDRREQEVSSARLHLDVEVVAGEARQRSAEMEATSTFAMTAQA